jgi:hypothetical protein
MHAVLSQKRVQTIVISREREATSVPRIGFPICEPNGAAAAQVRIVRSTCLISLIMLKLPSMNTERLLSITPSDKRPTDRSTGHNTQPDIDDFPNLDRSYSARPLVATMPFLLTRSEFSDVRESYTELIIGQHLALTGRSKYRLQESHMHSLQRQEASHDP